MASLANKIMAMTITIFKPISIKPLLQLKSSEII